MAKLVDIHCHILPEIDDGSTSIQESLSMIKQAVEQGVTDIIATPHYIPGEIEYDFNMLTKKVDKLQKEVENLKINCKIHPGTEIYLWPEIIDLFKNHKILPLARTSKYCLVEFPANDASVNLLNLLHEIRICGYLPIIAHPERNWAILKDPSIINDLLDQNVLLQVNAGSILGSYGKDVQKFAMDLVKQRLVSFVASDGHSAGRRKIKLAEAKSFLDSKVDSEYLDILFSINGKKIIQNEKIFSVTGGYRFKKRRIWVMSFRS